MSFYDKFNTLCHFVTNMHIVSLCDKHTLCFCAMNMHKNKVYVNGLIRPKESPNRQCDILQHYQVPPFQHQLCIGQPTKPLPLFSLQGQKTQTGHVSPPPPPPPEQLGTRTDLLNSQSTSPAWRFISRVSSLHI